MTNPDLLAFGGPKCNMISKISRVFSMDGNVVANYKSIKYHIFNKIHWPISDPYFWHCNEASTEVIAIQCLHGMCMYKRCELYVFAYIYCIDVIVITVMTNMLIMHTYIETPKMFPFIVPTDFYILEEETAMSTSAWIQKWHA